MSLFLFPGGGNGGFTPSYITVYTLALGGSFGLVKTNIFKNSTYSAPNFITTASAGIVFAPVAGTFAVPADGDYGVWVNPLPFLSGPSGVTFEIRVNGVLLYMLPNVDCWGSQNINRPFGAIVPATAGQVIEVWYNVDDVGDSARMEIGTAISIGRMG